jgi:hypothetical protein
MTYYAGFEPFTVKEHNEEVFREVSRLRLEKRLRDNRQPRSARVGTFIFQRLMSLPRRGRSTTKPATRTARVRVVRVPRTG